MDDKLDDIIYKSTTTNSNKKSSRYLFFAASTACLAGLICGICFGWTSPILPKLNGSIDPEINPLPTPTTPNQESWIASLLSLGAVLGPLITGKLLTKFGRKTTILLMTTPILLSFLLIIFTNNVYVYYISRFIQGIGLGSLFTVLPIYLGEISQDHNRGQLGCLLGVFISFGVLYAFGIGPILTVKNFTIACILPILLFLVVFGCLIPESPQFYANIDNRNKLEDSLRILRPSRYDIDGELSKFNKPPSKDQQQSVWELIRIRANRKSLIICSSLLILQQLSGINAVQAYMQIIFESASTSLSSELAVIVVGLVQVGITMLTALIVDKLGRKLLLFVSTLFCCISLFLLGCYFKFNLKNFNWLPILSLIVYIIAFNIGLGPIPWALMGELISNDFKAYAATFVSFIAFAMSFIVTLAFPIISLYLGMSLSFWIFTICCLFGCIFIYCFVPETKGRTLDEIQQILAK